MIGELSSQSSASSLLILGDVFFRSYIVTFDKANSQIGFYGNTTLIETVGVSFFALSQYIMVPILGILVILYFSLLFVLKMKKGNKELSQFML